MVFYPWLLVELLVALPAEADLLAVLEGLEPDANAGVALRANEKGVGSIQRGFLLHDPSLALLVGTLVPLDHVELLDHDSLPVGKDLRDLAGLALFPAGDDLDRVAFFQSVRLHDRFLFPAAHSTSGASEMIFINCLARNSRATGPKILVPIGSN